MAGITHAALSRWPHLDDTSVAFTSTETDNSENNKNYKEHALHVEVLSRGDQSVVRSIHSSRLLGLVLIFSFLDFTTFPGSARAQSDEPIKPIPLESKLDPAKVAL